MIREFLQKHYHIFISACDCSYWIASSLIFMFLPISEPCPLPVLLLLMFIMVIGREMMAIVLEYALFHSSPVITLILPRLLYGLGIVYFFLTAIRLAGIGLLSCILLPAFLCIIFFPVLFYKKNQHAEAPPDRVRAVFEDFCRLHKKSGIKLYSSAAAERTIFSDYYPHPAIVYSPDLNELQKEEILFLIAHETAHIENRHFIKNRIVEGLLLVVHSFVPFLFLGAVKPVFFACLSSFSNSRLSEAEESSDASSARTCRPNS